MVLAFFWKEGVVILSSILERRLLLLLDSRKKTTTGKKPRDFEYDVRVYFDEFVGKDLC